MQILSHGFLKPDPSDTGDVVFPALQTNIQKLNDHTHDGTDAALVAITTQSLLAINWVAAPIGGGLYRQLVTMPVGFLFDAVNISFRLTTGEFLYPSIERASATTYYIYINDNTLGVTAIYG